MSKALHAGGRTVTSEAIQAIWSQESQNASVTRMQVLVAVGALDEPIPVWSWDLDPDINRRSSEYQAAYKASLNVETALLAWVGWDLTEAEDLCDLPELYTYFGPGEDGYEKGWSRGVRRARRRLGLPDDDPLLP